MIEAKPAGQLTGTAVLSIELVSLKVGTRGGPRNVAVVTQELSSKAAGRGANAAAKTGGGAVLGGVIGALAGGGRGAAIGAASGGALGAGTNTITRGQEIDVKPEQLLQFKTTEPLNVTISPQRTAVTTNATPRTSSGSAARRAPTAGRAVAPIRIRMDSSLLVAAMEPFAPQ